MAIDYVTELRGYDFEVAQRFANGLASKMTGNKLIIKFDGVALRCLQTKLGLKLEGDFYSMQFMFIYAHTTAYMYTDNIPRPLALFYDMAHIIAAYLKLKTIDNIVFQMKDSEIEHYIASLVKSTDKRFKKLAELVYQFKWPRPVYESIAGNLTIHWHSDSTENELAQKIITRFKKEYMVKTCVLLELHKGYSKHLMMFCEKDTFYDSSEISLLEALVDDLNRIVYKFIVKAERGDKDVARTLNLDALN